ncbi:hypothetical protein ACQRIU_001753 [Beauveria bassiana]
MRCRSFAYAKTASYQSQYLEAGGTYAFVTAYFGSLRKASGLEQPGDPYNLAAYHVADHCFINTLTHVSSFTATAMPSRAGFQDYNGKFGWYDEVLDGCGMSNRQRWTQDLTVVDETTLGGGLPDTGAAPQDNASLSRLGRVQVYLGILQTNGPRASSPSLRDCSQKVRSPPIQVSPPKNPNGLRYAAAPGALVGVGAAVTTRCAARALVREGCVWEDLKDTVEAARGCILLRRRPFHNQGGLLHQLLPEHRHAQPEAIGLLPTAVSHRLERPGPRVPWSVAAVQEELSLGYVHRYTDSRSHIKPEAKDAVEEAKLRYAALPPAGLVHEVAEIVEEESFFLTEFNFFTMHHEA